MNEETARKYRSRKEYEKALAFLKQNEEKLVAEYSETVVTVPWARLWDYAIPENYTNFQDGFLWQTAESHRGMPIIRYEGKILYLRKCYEFLDDLNQRILCFDRQGSKYRFDILLPQEGETESGNPSYWEFIKKTKPYIPTPRALYERKKNRR